MRLQDDEIDNRAASSVAPRLCALINRQLDRRLYVGVQVYASIRGCPLLSFGAGMATDREPMFPQTPVPLLCCVKPLTAVLVVSLAEQCIISLDDRVCEFLPAFGQGEKADFRIRHLLTHATPVRKDPIFVSPRGTKQDVLRKICAINADEGCAGEVGNYAISWAWIILGEIASIVTGQPIGELLMSRVIEPLGLGGARAGFDDASWEANRHLISDLYLCRGAVPAYMYDSDSERTRREATTFYPSTGGTGTARDLGHLLEFLAAWRQAPDRPISMIAASDMRRRHRAGLPEGSSGQLVDFGLGLQLQTPVPEGQEGFSYGPLCSPEAFGHRSYQCSMMYADPAVGLTFVFLTNGVNSTVVDNEKCRAASEAIYADLALGR